VGLLFAANKNKIASENHRHFGAIEGGDHLLWNIGCLSSLDSDSLQNRRNC
tara:strand:+ start:627 stop:779 length:153 start_codon:yes stop_codon:yes gene_type:complete